MKTIMNFLKSVIDFVHHLFHHEIEVENGEFTLFYGNAVVEIEIPCDREVNEVYVAFKDFEDCECSQVCGGEISKIGYTICEDKIVFYVDIKSNICKIKWFYTYTD